MSLCVRILASKSVRCLTSPNTPQLTLTRGLRRELKPNVTHHSYYKILQHGKGPASAKSLAQVLEAQSRIDGIDPRLSYLVDIGLPPPKKILSLDERTSLLLKNRSDPALEKLSRTKSLEISLEEVEKAWEESQMPQSYCDSAKHYNIFQDLYGDAFFLPRVSLNVVYNKDSEKAVKVYRGNIIKPSQVSKPPTVTFNAAPESLWTLILTNPDGHLTDKNAEYVHWFIGNIPGNDVSKGQVVWNYLQPFPPHGTGYQRLVFVLYKQEERLDYSALQKKSPCLDLTQRTFNTYDFYRSHQDVLTPAGLCFYQSNWDQSVTTLFHNILEMEAPHFRYDFPEDSRAKQRWYPGKHPFDLYLDKFRDPRDINKRYLIKKLTSINPFEKPPAPFKYPLAQRIDPKTPSWLKVQMRRDRLGIGRIRSV